MVKLVSHYEGQEEKFLSNGLLGVCFGKKVKDLPRKEDIDKSLIYLITDGVYKNYLAAFIDGKWVFEYPYEFRFFMEVDADNKLSYFTGHEWIPFEYYDFVRECFSNNDLE